MEMWRASENRGCFVHSLFKAVLTFKNLHLLYVASVSLLLSASYCCVYVCILYLQHGHGCPMIGQGMHKWKQVKKLHVLIKTAAMIILVCSCVSG